jgi:four helix bundle protein
MARIERVEDIEAWKKGRELAKTIYTATSAGAFREDPALRDQVRRAAVSVPSNIAEGFERGGDKEFRQFLAQAKGSTGEIKTHLYVALDVGYLSQAKFDELYRLAAEAGRLLGGFMRYLSRSTLRGSKYRRPATQD